MRKAFLLIAASCLCTLVAVRWTEARQPSQIDAAAMDEVLKAVRADLIDSHAGILGKQLTLTGAQAATFWPMYAAYQKAQSAILDEQLQGIQQFIEKFDTLDDATAMRLIQSHLGRDRDMATLRERWLGDFQKVLGTRLAVRAMQIDRRVSLLQQFQLTTKIPLAQ